MSVSGPADDVAISVGPVTASAQRKRAPWKRAKRLGKDGASVLRLFHLRRSPFVSSSCRGKPASTPTKPASSSIALNETALRW